MNTGHKNRASDILTLGHYQWRNPPRLVMAGAHSPEGNLALGSPSGPTRKGVSAMITYTAQFVVLLLARIVASILLIEKLGPGIIH